VTNFLSREYFKGPSQKTPGEILGRGEKEELFINPPSGLRKRGPFLVLVPHTYYLGGRRPIRRVPPTTTIRGGSIL